MIATGRVLAALGGAVALPACGPGTDELSAPDASPEPGLAALDGPVAEALTVLVRDLFPGPGLTADHYRRVLGHLDTLAAEPPTRGLIIAGVASLDAGEGSWAGRPAEDRYRRLREIEATPFFQFIRYQSMATLYGDPSVWALYGYEGGSLSKGGYLNRGLNDLDWLPEPEPAPWPV